MTTKILGFLFIGLALSSCQTTTDSTPATQAPVSQGEVIEPLTFVQIKRLFSDKTFAVPGEKTGGRWRQSITYFRDDTNRAYRYYPHWTKTGLDYYAFGKITKEYVNGPRTFAGKTFNNLQAFCITDELNRNSSACSTVFRKGGRYYLGTDLSAEIVFSDGYHNLLTPLVQRAVKDNNNKALWALAGDFKRLEPDLVGKYRLANMRVWAHNQDAIRAENARIDAERKRDAAKRSAEAEARRKAREAKCMRDTGKACSSGGGLLGAVIKGAAGALIRGSEGGASTSSGTTIYHPTRKYILICREQGLLSDHVPTISISCTGEEQSCKQQFEQQVSSKYGSFSSACGKLVKANWYYSTIRIE